MLSFVSICMLPDLIKPRKWLMWEYRELWRGSRKHYGFASSWSFIRTTTKTYMLIEEIKCSRLAQSSAQSPR